MLPSKHLDRLDDCHPDLKRLFLEVTNRTQIFVLEGHRSYERQKELFAGGATKTMKSRHLTSPSEAVDVAPIVAGTINWGNLAAFKALAVIVKEVAQELGIEVEWGGDWKSFVDMPHWQLRK